MEREQTKTVKFNSRDFIIPVSEEDILYFDESEEVDESGAEVGVVNEVGVGVVSTGYVVNDSIVSDDLAAAEVVGF